MLTWLRRSFVGLAALLLLLFGAALAVERSGLLVRLVRARLARELGPLSERITMEGAELRWFEPGLELRGLSLQPRAREGVPDLELERVHLTFSRRLDALQSVHVEGGRVRLGPRLIEDWNRLASARAAGPDTPPPAIPSAAARAIALDLELEDGESFELGRLDLCARPGAIEGVELAGTIAPSLGGAVTAPTPIRVNGVLTASGARLWASARALALRSRALSASTLTDTLPIQEGTALLTLDSSFELDYGVAALPRGHLRASLSEGNLLARDDLPPLTQLALELEAILAPPPGSAVWSRESFEARASVRARAGETPLWAWVEGGRSVPAGAWLRAWGRADAVPLDLGGLAFPRLRAGQDFVQTMLAPRGAMDLAASLVLGQRDGRWTQDLALAARSDGRLALAYMGYPGEPHSGLPVPLENVRGELLLGLRSQAERPWRLAALGLAGEHGSGFMNGWLQATAPARGAAFLLPEFDLLLSSPSIAVDETLLRALAANHELAWIEPGFRPQNGTVAGDFRLRTGAELAGTCASGSLRLSGVSLRWSELPVPLEGADGSLELRWGKEPSLIKDRPLRRRRPVGVTYLFDNRAGPRLGAQARVEGWWREASLPPVFDPATAEEPLQEIRVDIDELGLRGRDFDILAASFPALEREVADYGAVGRTRVSFHGSQPTSTALFRSRVEVTPLVMHVRPQFFQRQTRDLRGRILILGEEHTDGERTAERFVLAGTWPGGVELIAEGTIPESGDASVRVYGAGIDPSNTSFKGALITSLASDASTGGVDLSGWTLRGRVDFALESSFDLASPAPAINRYRFQLRDNEFSADDLVLRDLRGTFVQNDELLSSPRLEATLGTHPLELREVLFFPLAILPRVHGADPLLTREGFWSDPLGRALQAEVYTRDLPLDAEHLTGLLDEPTLASLRANPSWRGALDVLGAKLLVTSEGRDEGKVALRGAMRAHDLDLRLGLPIRIDSARITLEESIVESHRLRGWARIDDLEARIAERELADASMIAGYVDGRLTIDNLSGDFEGGRLESLGGALGGARKALGIDLAEPHRFDVAVSLRDVSVGGLLRGVFQSSIADEGVLAGSLQLSGTPGDILALTGRGALSLDEGALWSVPVMRELFQRLGFDRGGLFDRLRSRFELRDGRILVSHLEIQSAILDLVGEGWQDLDGQLAYDLEVRYGLLDRLGPFGRLLYWLNNSLVRVAVRGDFERPEVRIRNSILELLSGFEDDPPRKLPLPGFSALGARF